MSYSQFTLQQVTQQFKLKIVEVSTFLPPIEPIYPNPYLAEYIERHFDLALALNTEKARSEMLICPILLGVKEALAGKISLFSGEEFTVEPETGLNGICDYILSRSSEQLFVTAPIAIIVEAKKEDLKSGLGQCAAEMLAAQKFNVAKQISIPIIYGAITTGSIWRFLKLEEQTLTIGLREYPALPIEQILGILVSFISD
ncbi:MAG: hypothetical protein EAZ09_12770 [Oscillatoriales cyanobacterium]|nr:MAG: hypothetical protein EAZ18_03685 [Oscillatoriales cyanobacterium]TAH21332.1 MAG: hypothetical protein EAZ09_12770 [Oscillatoriales cyanobacterium]